MSGAVAAEPRVEKAADLAEAERSALRDLILVLADSKRLLGIRYSDWMLGAPTIEAGIAASSMAQDEWGHSRLTYALLGDFGDEPWALEHERPASEYRAPEVLDEPLGSWAELIAAALLVDTALSVQYQALAESRYAPAHNRVAKLLDEERFHFRHAVGWTRRLAHALDVRDEFAAALARMLPGMVRWFGRDDAPATQILVGTGLVRGGPDALRARFLATVGPTLAEAGLAEGVGLHREGEGYTFRAEPTWDGWNDAARRGGGGGPDAETLGRIRGDRNRAFLMD